MSGRKRKNPEPPLNVDEGFYDNIEIVGRYQVCGGRYVGVRLVGDKGAPRLEHVMVMERHLGRRMTKDEDVHHRNGNRWDNRLANLEVWARGKQPRGQRIPDLLDAALETLLSYPEEAARRPSWKEVQETLAKHQQKM